MTASVPAFPPHPPPPPPSAAEPVQPRPPGLAARAIARADAAANALYGWRYNPLYRSGTLTVWLMAVLIVTGLYLLLFYRVGAPYASVVRIAEQTWAGAWIRGVHRLASDLVVITAAVHAFRMFAQRRSWGRRTLAWFTGVGLVGLILVCGWTGYVMVWDAFGHLLAVQGARLLDLVPLFSEPLGRAFVGEQAIPSAFFFLNLFLHIALPIGMGVLLMMHVGHLARPALFPSRRVMWIGTAMLIGAALVWPFAMAAPADSLRIPAQVPLDLFYAFWVPAAERLPAIAVLLGFVVLGVPWLLVPRLTRPRPALAPPPSVVNERLCTGCEQCVKDCPYEAITMIPRPAEPSTPAGRFSAMVARVDPAHCVSCGICAGSCAPMGVGPEGRTGRDQLDRARRFIAERAPGPTDVVVIACRRGAGGAADTAAFDGSPVLPVDCAGALHTSVVELLVRSGAGGVAILSCPRSDCWNREGPTWLEQRLYFEREAELKERVDRRRIVLAELSMGERGKARHVVRDLRARIEALARGDAEPDPHLSLECVEDDVQGEVA